MALLEVAGLTTDIRLSKTVVHALDDVSLTVEAGQTVGLVGESGCGKTMTAMSIERLLPPGGHITGGRVLFDGVDLVALPEKRMRAVRGGDIGMIFQDPMTSLNPVQPIGEQVAEPLLLHRGLSRAQAREPVLEMLRLVGIPHPEQRVDSYPHQLSGGQRQRVMIAMALICHPKLLIADEPTTALDVTVQKQILELIDSLREELGMAVILITHDLGVIAGRADRVVVMYAGRVAETAETQTLFERPRHRYTEALFEALPERAADTGERLYSIPGLPPELIERATACPFAPRCRFATEQCRTEQPALEPADDGDPTHRFACFVPRDEPMPVASTIPRDAAESASLDERDWVAPPGSSPPTAPRCWRSTDWSKTFRSPAAVCCAPGSAPSAPSPARRSRSRAGRRWDWSASRAAARRRSGGSWWGSTCRRAGASCSAGVRSRIGIAAICARTGATCSSCSRMRTRPSTPACGCGRSCASRSRSSTWAPHATATGASTSCSKTSDCPGTPPSGTRTSSRADSGSASGWPAPLRCSRRSSSPTSRSRRSTCRCRRRC